MPDDFSPTHQCPNWQDPRERAKQLAEGIVRRWHAHEEEPCADKYLKLHPELVDYPEGGVHLVYEEACLRREAGNANAYAEALNRYPDWRRQLEVMLRCHSVLHEGQAEVHEVPDWPTVGESLSDFSLLAELGRGGLARVFLAAQHGLADRPVVLKLTPRAGHEHVCLARLQHTHIVPLYSVQDDVARKLRILCMPYLGGTTLTTLLEALEPVPVDQRSGRHLLKILDCEQAAGPLSLPTEGPARNMLGRLSYVEAVCWIGACLADALQYAHERGLVHLDVKPSNVLLAADAEPLLLDFNVAQQPLRPGGPPPDEIGGTPMYMPPEQEAAMRAIKEGRAVPMVVDGRADIYALGRILYEMLGGVEAPDNGPSLPLPLWQLNPDVSVGLSDLVTRCLAPAAADRYGHAADLAADLRRHLTHQPLRGVANRSLAERWRKWRRRRPQALHRLAMLIAVLGAALGLGLYELDRRRGQEQGLRRQREQAEAALVEGRQHVRAGAWTRAADVLRRGLDDAQGLPGDDLRSQLDAELARAQRGELAARVHQIADRLRFIAGGALPADRAALLARWQVVWSKRAELLDSHAELPALVQEQLTEDLRDLGLIGADLRVRLARLADRDRAQLEALRILDETEALVGPSVVLARQRQVCLEGLGKTEEARQAAKQAGATAPRSAWEHAALGRAFLERGELEKAAVQLHRARELAPGDFWACFYEAVCAYRRGHHAEAVAGFSECVGRLPGSPECCFNRGLAWRALGDKDKALSDWTRALALDPRLGPALLNRGILYRERKRYTDALADLTRALDAGCDPAVVYYHLALVYEGQQDRAAALASVEQALLVDPRHPGAIRLRDNLTRRRP